VDKNIGNLEQSHADNKTWIKAMVTLTEGDIKTGTYCWLSRESGALPLPMDMIILARRRIQATRRRRTWRTQRAAPWTRCA